MKKLLSVVMTVLIVGASFAGAASLPMEKPEPLLGQGSTSTQASSEINHEAVIEQMLRESNVNVFQDGVRIGSLALVLATELARLVNKDRVVIRNVCQRDGELNIDDCKLTLQYGDIAGGTTPGQSAIFSYTLQRRLSVPVGENEFSFSPTVVLEIHR